MHTVYVIQLQEMFKSVFTSSNHYHYNTLVVVLAVFT